MINIRSVLSFLTAAVLLSIPFPLLAADATDITPVQLTVLSEGADNVTSFSTIAGAVSAVKDSGPEKPYTIIVNPGQYDEQVILPPYVSIAGVGKSAAIKAITSGGCSSESAPTLIISNDSSIKNLSIENKNPDGCSTAILIKGGGTDIEDVDMSATGKESHGIQISASKDDIISIKQAKINTESTFSDAWGILVFPHPLAALTIENVTSSCNNRTGNNCGGIAVWRTVHELNITDSTFISKGGKNAIAMDLYAGGSLIKTHSVKATASGGKLGTFGARVGDNANVFFNNSEIKASGPNSIGILMQSTGKLTVNSGTIYGETMGLKQQTDKGIFEIKDCTLVGGHNGFKGVDTMYNCRDGNGNLLDDF